MPTPYAFLRTLEQGDCLKQKTKVGTFAVNFSPHTYVGHLGHGQNYETAFPSVFSTDLSAASAISKYSLTIPSLTVILASKTMDFHH